MPLSFAPHKGLPGQNRSFLGSMEHKAQFSQLLDIFSQEHARGGEVISYHDSIGTSTEATVLLCSKLLATSGNADDGLWIEEAKQGDACENF